MTTETPILVTFGLGGHTVYFATEHHPGGGSSSSKLSGYDSACNWPSRGTIGPEYEGVPVFDGCAAYRAKPRLALDSPMVNQEGEVERFRDIPTSMVEQALAHGNGEQRTMAGMAAVARAEPSFTGLDSIPVTEWLDWQREQSVPHGARIGVITDGAIVWEGGAS